MTEKKGFLKKAFEDMKQSAKEQHEVDKANFKAVKAESRANFEENRGKNTLKKSKEIGKQSWNDAKMSIGLRQEKIRKDREEQIAITNERIEKAEKRLEDLIK